MFHQELNCSCGPLKGIKACRLKLQQKRCTFAGDWDGGKKSSREILPTFLLASSSDFLPFVVSSQIGRCLVFLCLLSGVTTGTQQL